MGFSNIWNLIPRPNLTHLSTYICVYMCVCVGVCVCVHTHVRGRIYIHTHAHMYGCTHTRVYTCMSIYPTHSVITVPKGKEKKNLEELEIKTCCHSDFSERLFDKICVKKLTSGEMIIKMIRFITEATKNWKKWNWSPGKKL